MVTELSLSSTISLLEEGGRPKGHPPFLLPVERISPSEPVLFLGLRGPQSMDVTPHC